jgi:hypothetical protein
MREGLTMFATERIEAGQAVYSPMVLRTYDSIVLGLSNRFLWRCPTAELLRLYDRNVSERHLDVGVGTGYFLDKSRWPVAKPAITLLDLNPNCLTMASRRIRRFTPQTVRANTGLFDGPFVEQVVRRRVPVIGGGNSSIQRPKKRRCAVRRTLGSASA